MHPPTHGGYEPPLRTVLLPRHGLTDNGWEITPHILGPLLDEAVQCGFPLVITENGLADGSDWLRPAYQRMHAAAASPSAAPTAAAAPSPSTFRRTSQETKNHEQNPEHRRPPRHRLRHPGSGGPRSPPQQQAFGSTNAVIRVEPDLVLLDVNMPGLSGDRLAQVLRTNANTRDVLIVLHSSNDEDHLRTTSRRLGLDATSAKAAPRCCARRWPRCWCARRVEKRPRAILGRTGPCR